MSGPTTTSAALPEPNRAAQPLVLVFAAVAVGIIVDRHAPLPIGGWWGIAATTWAAWWLCRRIGHDGSAAVTILVAAGAIAGGWHHWQWSLFARGEVGLRAGAAPQPVCLEGWATGGPRRVPAPADQALRTIPVGDRTRLELEVTAIRDRDEWQDAAGRTTLVVDGHLLGVQAGDRLRVFGQLSAIQSPANPGEFDFAAHNRADRRMCLVRCELPECVSRLSSGSLLSPRRWIAAASGQGDAVLWQRLSPARAGLGAAMFLGLREELDQELSLAFLETGTIHLLVVSGLNVGILAMFLWWFRRTGLIGDRAARWAVAAAAVAYALLTDLQPPVVRATIMVLVVLVAQARGRRSLGFNTLAAAALVVLALNPADLFRVGTQLSFLSVAVIIWLGQARWWQAEPDPLARLLAWSRPPAVHAAYALGRICWRAILLSSVIWLVVTPLVAARFHLISPVALIVGPLMSAIVLVAMLSGFALVAVGWLIAPLAAGCGWVCDTSLAALNWSVDWSQRMPGGHWWVAGPSDWWLAGAYAALVAYWAAPRWRASPRWCAALAMLWVAVGLGAALAPRDRDRLTCTFVSVGHGLAVVLELPEGQTILYDAGRMGSPEAATQSVAGYLWSRGITRLDAVVVSHADADHYNALPALFERFGVGRFYVSPVMFEQSDRALDALRTAIARRGLPLAEIWGGDRLRAAESVRIEVLHPPRTGVLGADNANSVVLAVEFQGRRILLTGDLESPGLEALLEEEPLDCDIVSAPHHGSARSNPPGFARWSRPDWVVVSGGVRDVAAEVSDAFGRGGAAVLHTARDGAVQFAIEHGQVQVSTVRGTGR